MKNIYKRIKCLPLFFISILVCSTIFASPEEIIKDILPGRGLQFDKQGGIYVDISPHIINRYSPAGKLICQIGKKGEGPGDIKRLGWFAFHPQENNIYVTEFVNGNKWISRFSRKGEFLGEWPCEMDWKKYGGLTDINFDSSGNAYIQTYKLSFRPYKDFRLGTITNILLKFSPRGKLLKELYTFKTDFNAEKGGKGNITIPFHNYLFWTLCRDRLYIREHYDEHIKVFDGEGNCIRSLHLPFAREKVREKDLEEWETWMKSAPWVRKGMFAGWFDLKYWTTRLPFPEYKPVSGRPLFYDSNGDIYSKKYEGHKPVSNTWAKINPTDNTTSIQEFKTRDRLLGIWKNCFYFARSDRYGNYVVVKVDKKELFNYKKE